MTINQATETGPQQTDDAGLMTTASWHVAAVAVQRATVSGAHGTCFHVESKQRRQGEIIFLRKKYQPAATGRSRS